MKVLIFTNERGSKIALPLEVVAKDRATYYVARDKDTTYDEEFNYVMDDDYEAIDWFRNNMDADDVAEHFVVLREESQPSILDLVDGSDVAISTMEKSK